MTHAPPHRPARLTRVVLLQARNPGDFAIDHELECFARRSGLAPAAFETMNLACEPYEPRRLMAADCVMVGGSGEYSVVHDDPLWIDDLLDAMRTIVRRRQPMFASCFGFQALCLALGGEVVCDPEREELGTHEIALTDQGRRDPIFGQLPESFDANLGHHDSVVEVPDPLVCLARTDRCCQAVRVPDAPIFGTQFHPELRCEDNVARFVHYLHEYGDPSLSLDEARRQAWARHRPDHHAGRLLPAFVDHVQRDAVRAVLAVDAP